MMSGEARHTRSIGRGVSAQNAAFASLLSSLAVTEYGRSCGITAGMTYDQFRRTVPARSPGQFAPQIERMAAGETDILWPGACRFFVQTAGTTGQPHWLPVTEAMLGHYRKGLRSSLLSYANRVRHPGVFLGRHVHAGASTALEEQNAAYTGSFDAMLALCLSPWAEQNLYAPSPETARLPESREKFEAIVAEMRGQDVTLIGGDPAAVLALVDTARRAMRDDQGKPAALTSVWPNLECCIHQGAPTGLFADELRAGLGATIALHEVYAAAEGFVATQDGDASLGLRMLVDAGIFFEFLPARDFNEDNLASLGERFVPLGGVEADTDYAVFATTPAGLCRCALGDIVRFVSLDPPRIHFAGRTRLRLDTCGERVGEKELTESLLAVCRREGWRPINFHVAPHYSRTTSGLARSCHEWWIELRPGSLKTPTGPVLAPLLDAELCARHRGYAVRRQSRALEAPVIRLVMPGIFHEWARDQAVALSPGKMPRCRPDRLIADPLAALTKFHTATSPPLSAGRDSAPRPSVRLAADPPVNPLQDSRDPFR